MFSSPKRSETGSIIESGNRPDVTTIARGVRVQGDFASQGDVVIEGEVQGHITTTGVLSVGPEAKLKADVAADTAIVAGLIEGNLTMKKRLELKSTAHIVGDIACETAIVEEGAVLQGKVTIGANVKREASGSGTSSTKTSTTTT